MKTWVDGELITAESLNALEEGVDGAATAASGASSAASNAAAAASEAQSTATAAAEAAAGAAPVGHTHHRLDNDHGHVTLDSEGGVQQFTGDVRVWWVNSEGRLVEGEVPASAIDGYQGRIENVQGNLTLDTAGGVQHWVGDTRVWWVDDTGRLREGRVPRLDNPVGSFLLDSAGGAQHHVGGTRVWWVDDTGELVQGSIPWERITGAPESGADTHRLDNDLGYLTLDSAGGLQHGTTGSGRVWWVNHLGELQQGTVPWSRITGAPDSSGSGAATAALKVVPLALTTGQTQVESGLTSRGLRLPIRFNAPIHRWRLHIRNWNPRLGQIKTAGGNLWGVWLADSVGGGNIANARRVAGQSTIPSGESEYVSEWSDEPLGGDVERLLCISYSGFASAPYALVGGSYQTASGDANIPGASVTRHATTPLDIWIEAETPASTPVIAGVGDSLTSGVGATLPVHDSWVSQYSRRIGGLPMHVSHAGDSMLGFQTVNPDKVTRWAHLARADAVVWALGSNDIASDRPVSSFYAQFTDLRPVIEGAVGPIHYVAKVQPRNGWDGDKEWKRTVWNNWLAGQPGVRGVLDFAAVVSADGDTLRPEYDSGDGTHLNTAGYAAEAASITTPLTSPPVITQVQSIEDRLAPLLYSSGLRDITDATVVESGKLLLQVHAGAVYVYFEDVKVTEGGTVYLAASGTLSSVAPASRHALRGTVTASVSAPRRIDAHSHGALRVLGAQAGDTLTGTVVWPFERPIPTTLPGSPA